MKVNGNSAGVPLRHIQEISGHNDLGTLQRESGSHTRAAQEGCFGDWILNVLGIVYTNN